VYVDPSGLYYWTLFTWGLAAGKAGIACYELKKCLECLHDTDVLLTKMSARMPPLQFAQYRMSILNSHPCYSICSAAGIDGMKAMVSFGIKWLPYAVSRLSS
jgi:hypothetical protein